MKQRSIRLDSESVLLACAERSKFRNPSVRLRNEHMPIRRGNEEYTGSREKTICCDPEKISVNSIESEHPRT